MGMKPINLIIIFYGAEKRCAKNEGKTQRLLRGLVFVCMV